jgi:hypothetical protein
MASTRWRRSDCTTRRTLAGSESSELTVSTLYRAARAAMVKCIWIDVGP